MENDSKDKEKNPRKGQGITRRRFLKTVGSGAAVAAASDVLAGLGTVQAAQAALTAAEPLAQNEYKIPLFKGLMEEGFLTIPEL